MNDNYYRKHYVYVLKLENNKYYVGETTNIENRIEYHTIFKTTDWTSKYSVDSLKELYEVEIIGDFNDDDKKYYNGRYRNCRIYSEYIYENKISSLRYQINRTYGLLLEKLLFLKYVQNYGIDNVRGSDWSEVIINPYRYDIIKDNLFLDVLVDEIIDEIKCNNLYEDTKNRELCLTENLYYSGSIRNVLVGESIYNTKFLIQILLIRKDGSLVKIKESTVLKTMVKY